MVQESGWIIGLVTTKERHEIFLLDFIDLKLPTGMNICKRFRKILVTYCKTFYVFLIYLHSEYWVKVFEKRDVWFSVFIRIYSLNDFKRQGTYKMNTFLLLPHNLSVLKTFLHIEEWTSFITLIALYEFLILTFFLQLDFYVFTTATYFLYYFRNTKSMNLCMYN